MTEIPLWGTMQHQHRATLKHDNGVVKDGVKDSVRTPVAPMPQLVPGMAAA
jgi:hypothetical protein